MDPQVLLEQAEVVESVGHERRVVPSRVLLRQIRRQVEVELSWVMFSGWVKGVHHLEPRGDGRGWILAPVLVLILVEVLTKEISVRPEV